MIESNNPVGERLPLAGDADHAAEPARALQRVEREQPLDAEATLLAVPAVPEPGAARASDRAELENEIRNRAYTRYLERGAADGDDLADWLAAEREALAARAYRGGAGSQVLDS